MIALAALGLPLALSLASASPAKESSKILGINLGGTMGVFMPTGGVLRDTFGSNRFQIGLRPIADKSFPIAWGRDFGVDAISAEKGDDKLFMAPFTMGMARRFGKEADLVRPYVRVAAGIAYMDYAIDRPGERVSAKRFGPTGNLEAGLQFGKVAKVSATYHFFARYDGISFDGLELTLTATLFRF